MSANDFQQQPSPSLPPQDEPSVPPSGWQTDFAYPSRPHPNFFWSLLWCFLFLIVTQLPAAFVGFVIIVVCVVIAPELFPQETLTTSNPTAFLLSKPASIALGAAVLLNELMVVGFSLLVVRLVVGRDWTRQLALRRPGVAHVFLALASLPALVLLGDAAYNFLHNVLHVPRLSDWGWGGMEEVLQIAADWPGSFAVLVIGVGPGIGEELWCRGFLGRGLVGHYGPKLGVVAASFFFGLIHIDPCQGLMAVIMGLWLHFVYLTTRSLWLPMLLHFLNNSVAVLLPRWETMATTLNNIPTLVYPATFALMGATAYALYQSRARLAPRTPEQIFLWRPAWDGVEHPPPHSGTCVVHPFPSLSALVLVALSLTLLAAAWAS